MSGKPYFLACMFVMMSPTNILPSSKGLEHTWHWVSSRGGLPWELGRIGTGLRAKEAEAWCLRKWDWTVTDSE